MAYDKKDAEKFLGKVMFKLDASAVKYSDNAYTIADIPKEVDEELIDLVGWPLLEVLRLREVLSGKLVKIEEIYWNTFLKRQTTEFLIGVYKKIFDELVERKTSNLHDGSLGTKLQNCEKLLTTLADTVLESRDNGDYYSRMNVPLDDIAKKINEYFA
jgi:hypothetical protein